MARKLSRNNWNQHYFSLTMAFASKSAKWNKQ